MSSITEFRMVVLTKNTVGDYSLFLKSWTQPAGGIHGYLARFLHSGDPTFQHIGIWTLLQLLESGDEQLIRTVTKAEDIMAVVREISERNVESLSEGEAPSASRDGGNSAGATGSAADGAESEDGEAEVVALARRCLEISAEGGESNGK